MNGIASGRRSTPNSDKRLRERALAGPLLPPSLRSGATSEFMDGLSYTTIIELAEPFTRRRSSLEH